MAIEPVSFPLPTQLQTLLSRARLASPVVVTSLQQQSAEAAIYSVKNMAAKRAGHLLWFPAAVMKRLSIGERVRHEAMLMKKFPHPHCLAVWDAGEIDGAVFVILDEMPAQSLASRKRSGGQRLQDLVQLCQAIAHGHEHGLFASGLSLHAVGWDAVAGVRWYGTTLAAVMNSIATGGKRGQAVWSGSQERRDDVFLLGQLMPLLLGSQDEWPSELQRIHERATQANPSLRYADVMSLELAISACTLPQESDATSSRPRSAHAESAAELTEDQRHVRRSEQRRQASRKQWILAVQCVVMVVLAVVVFQVYQMVQQRKHEVETHNNQVMKEMAEREQRRADELTQLQSAAQQQHQAAAQAERDAIEQAKLKAAREEEIKKAAENAPKAPTAEEVLASVASMRDELRQGLREKFPLGTRDRGRTALCLVPQAMSWNDAQVFAEQCGAHLAIARNDDELAFLASMLPEGSSAWLGAGRVGKQNWGWVDGSKWRMAENPTGAGTVVAVSATAKPRALAQTKELPFVIEWLKDGTNPASLETLLTLVKHSLESDDQVLPPGTLTFGKHHYYPLLRKMTRSQAQAVATQAGARLASLAQPDEALWVESQMTEMGIAEPMWLGAAVATGRWSWADGEPWQHEHWAVGGNHAAVPSHGLVVRGEMGWESQPSDQTAVGAWLEWGRVPLPVLQKTQQPAEAVAPVSQVKEVIDLQDKARRLLQSLNREHREAVAQNTRSYGWDLDVWLRGLNGSEKERWTPGIALMKQAVQKDLVPMGKSMSEAGPQRYGTGARDTQATTRNEETDFPREMPAAVVKIYRYRGEKQQQLQQDYRQRAEKIRDGFVSKIEDFRKTLTGDARMQVGQQLDDVVSQAQDLQAWIDNLLR